MNRMAIYPDLEGRTIVVAGATRGIGKEISLLLGEQKSNVVLVARGGSNPNELIDRIKSAGGNAIYRSCDVTDYAAMKRVVTDSIAAFGIFMD